VVGQINEPCSKIPLTKTPALISSPKGSLKKSTNIAALKKEKRRIKKDFFCKVSFNALIS